MTAPTLTVRASAGALCRKINASNICICEARNQGPCAGIVVLLAQARGDIEKAAEMDMRRIMKACGK
jgi:hypothetical protein